MKQVLIVGLGGFSGSVLRYLIHLMYSNYIPDRFYLGTLTVNLVGCLLIGLLSGGLEKTHSTYGLLLMTGLCGGFTTFSSFALDGIKLIRTDQTFQFIAYSGVSMIGGLLLCMLGVYLMSK